ncbi:MAG: hypothetical protein FJ221_14195 [Lentisphaerae bacterium]|nr:hypothetical protein [Lentisphaerota bacterium]
MNPHPNVRAAAWLALLFTAGAAIGGTAMARRAPRSGWAGWPYAAVEESWRERRMENLRTHVGLTAEQEAAIAPAMDATAAELRELRESVRTRASRIIGRNSAAIRAELTPDQVAKYDAWLKQSQSRRPAAAPQSPKPTE